MDMVGGFPVGVPDDMVVISIVKRMIVKTAREKEVLIKMNLNLESDAECWDLLGPIQTWRKEMRRIFC